MKVRRDLDLLAKGVKKGWLPEAMMISLLRLPLVETVITDNDVELKEYMQSFIGLRTVKDLIEYKRHVLEEYVAYIDTRYIYLKVVDGKITNFGIFSHELKTFVFCVFDRVDESGPTPIYKWAINTTCKCKFPKTTSKGEPFFDYLMTYMATRMARLIAWLAYQDHKRLYAVGVDVADKPDAGPLIPITTAGMFNDKGVQIARPINGKRNNSSIKPKNYKHHSGSHVIFLDKLPCDKTVSETHEGEKHQQGHQRRGYTRRLKHPRFRNHPMYMDPQGIFVKPYWVGSRTTTYNGNVYTVLEK